MKKDKSSGKWIKIENKSNTYKCSNCNNQIIVNQFDSPQGYKENEILKNIGKICNACSSCNVGLNV